MATGKRPQAASLHSLFVSLPLVHDAVSVEEAALCHGLKFKHVIAELPAIHGEKNSSPAHVLYTEGMASSPHNPNSHYGLSSDVKEYLHYAVPHDANEVGHDLHELYHWHTPDGKEHGFVIAIPQAIIKKLNGQFPSLGLRPVQTISALVSGIEHKGITVSKMAYAMNFPRSTQRPWKPVPLEKRRLFRLEGGAGNLRDFKADLQRHIEFGGHGAHVVDEIVIDIGKIRKIAKE